MNGITLIVFGLGYGLSKSHLYKCVLKLIIYYHFHLNILKGHFPQSSVKSFECPND